MIRDNLTKIGVLALALFWLMAAQAVAVAVAAWGGMSEGWEGFVREL